MESVSFETVCEICGRKFSDGDRSEEHPEYCETCVREMASEEIICAEKVETESEPTEHVETGETVDETCIPEIESNETEETDRSVEEENRGLFGSILDLSKISCLVFYKNLDGFFSLGFLLCFTALSTLFGVWYYLHTLLGEQLDISLAFNLLNYNVLGFKELYDFFTLPEVRSHQDDLIFLLLGTVVVASLLVAATFRVMDQLVKEGKFRFGLFLLGPSMVRCGIATILIAFTLLPFTIGSVLFSGYLQSAMYEDAKASNFATFSKYEYRKDKMIQLMEKQGAGRYWYNQYYFSRNKSNVEDDYFESLLQVHQILRKDLRHYLPPLIMVASLLMTIFLGYHFLWVLPALLDRSIGFFRSFDASWRFPSEEVWNTLLTVFGLLLIGVLCTVAGFGIGFFFFFPFAVMVLTVQYILRTGQPIAVSGTGGEKRVKARA